MRELEAEIRREVERIFEEKRRRLGVEARLDLHVETVEAPPIVGENVYGEAFPPERPPRVWMEVFPEATTREITRTVCEELLHVKHPELSEGEIAKIVPACVREGGKRYSKETEEMLGSGWGYNCESYGEFYGPQPFKKVLEHEVEDMYNVHVLEETCRELGIECRGLEDPANVRVCMEAAEREIERRFGAGSKAIWLGTRSGVRTRYCTPGEKPVQYAIPEGAMVMSDLGPDGTLFLFPGGKEKEWRGWDIFRRAEHRIGSELTPAEFKRRSVRDVLENPREDEYYVLVTRYYPMEFRRRSLKIEDTPIDEWDRDLAPSPELLGWWKEGSKTSERWGEYTRRFLEEVPPVMIRRKAEIHQGRAAGKKVVFVCMEEEWEHPYCHTWILLNILGKFRG